MTAKEAIQRLKDMVTKCAYSTMKRVMYVALELENGFAIKMENSDTVWQWLVIEDRQPKLLEVKHKNKNKNRKTKKAA